MEFRSTSISSAYRSDTGNRKKRHAHSRAYFSLSCKILLFVILDGISMVFDDLRLPAELSEEDPEEDAT